MTRFTTIAKTAARHIGRHRTAATLSVALVAGLTAFGVDAMGLFSGGEPQQAEAWSDLTAWYVWRGGW